MNWRKWAIALLSVLAIAMVAWLISAQSVGAASLQTDTQEHECKLKKGGYNRYVSQPEIASDGTVTHPLTDIFLNSYTYAPKEDQHGWSTGSGIGTVLGYFVKSRGQVWEWDAGSVRSDGERIANIGKGQSVKACILQHVEMPDGGEFDWVIVSPAKYRR